MVKLFKKKDKEEIIEEVSEPKEPTPFDYVPKGYHPTKSEKKRILRGELDPLTLGVPKIFKEIEED